MGPTWGPPGSCGPQMGLMLAPWTLLSGVHFTFQTCQFLFMNWAHTENLLNFTLLSPEVELSAYEANGQWNLTKAPTFRFSISGDGINYPLVGFELHIKRFPAYFLVNTGVPVMLLTILSALVFVLPSDSGEKVSMQVTIMLANSVMLLVMSETTPKSGETQPLMSKSKITVRQYCVWSRRCRWLM